MRVFGGILFVIAFSSAWSADRDLARELDQALLALGATSAYVWDYRDMKSEAAKSDDGQFLQLLPVRMRGYLTADGTHVIAVEVANQATAWGTSQGGRPGRARRRDGSWVTWDELLRSLEPGPDRVPQSDSPEHAWRLAAFRAASFPSAGKFILSYLDGAGGHRREEGKTVVDLDPRVLNERLGEHHQGRVRLDPDESRGTARFILRHGQVRECELLIEFSVDVAGYRLPRGRRLHCRIRILDAEREGELIAAELNAIRLEAEAAR